MLIMQIGRLMSLGYEKIILLYNGSTYETADVISTYVYRRGILSADFSYSTAVGLFQSVIGVILLVTSNQISKNSVTAACGRRTEMAKKVKIKAKNRRESAAKYLML